MGGRKPFIIKRSYILTYKKNKKNPPQTQQQQQNQPVNKHI